MYLLAALLIVAIACVLLRYLPATTDFIPSADALFNGWQQTFVTTVSADPGSYALDPTSTPPLLTYSAAWVDGYALVTNPATKTKVTVAAKDAEKAQLKSYIRSMVKLIQASPAVTNEAKAAAGIPIHNNAPSPIPTPGTWPLVAVSGAGSLTIEGTMSDSDTPTSRRKPAGAIAMEVYAKTSATPITDTSELIFQGLATKSPFIVTMTNADAGKIAYVAGRWVTRTNLNGRFSTISSAVVPL